MSFKRQPLLELETEEQLKEKMHPLWSSGKPGRKIAKELQFGVKETTFEKVRPDYIFYYRHKFNTSPKNIDGTENKFFGKFGRRKKPVFSKIDDTVRDKRYKVPLKKLELMPVEEFVETLNKKLPFSDNPEHAYCRRVRSFLILLYFTPLRSSEIFERVYIEEDKDFTITDEQVTVHLLRKKKKFHKDDDEPINIPRVFPLVDELVEYLENKEWQTTDRETGKITNHRPWNISRWTARNYVKEVWHSHFPHYFRFNYLTEEASQPNANYIHLKSKSHLTMGAMDKYLFTTEKTEDEVDKGRIERYRKKGVI